MRLVLDNGNVVNMLDKPYNVFYGPNRIGKTQISKFLKKHYETIDENVLLFDENILLNMSIQDSSDENSFEIMPMVQEYTKYKNNVEKIKSKLAVKKKIKDICSIATQKAFAGFDILLDFVTNDVFTFKGKVVENAFLDKELKIIFKAPKTGLLNFFEIMNLLIEDKIYIVPENIKQMVNMDVYKVQKKINDNPKNFEKCPVCYNVLTKESKDKIKKSVEDGSIEDNLKESILSYLNDFGDVIGSLMTRFLTSKSYEDEKTKIISDIQSSFLFLLKDEYDVKDIDDYIENENKVNKILDEIKNFRLEDKPDTLQYIKDKLAKHSVYKNSSVDIEINDGKLKILNSPVEYSNMSKSEQNYFKFLYFDILVNQKTSDGSKLHIIVDDPFDSYDDIFVQDSINIIVNLISESIDKIDTFNIFSHSMYVIYLFDSIEEKHKNKFKIYWLDIVDGSNEIKIYNDNYNILHKVEINPFDYGFVLKISDKLVDKYSLIAFASVLRNELCMEKLLIKNNTETDIVDLRNKIEHLYENISESVNHIKQEISLQDLVAEINSVFHFDIRDSVSQNVSDALNDIKADFSSIDVKTVTTSGVLSLVDKNDICYILIYKYLLGIKIRREFERKAVADVGYIPYKEVGDLISSLTNNKLIDFYNTYNYIINSFNHSSTRIVPPIFVYSIQSLQIVYRELDAII